MFYHFRWLSGPMKQWAWICLSFVSCRLTREFNCILGHPWLKPFLSRLVLSQACCCPRNCPVDTFQRKNTSPGFTELGFLGIGLVSAIDQSSKAAMPGKSFLSLPYPYVGVQADMGARIVTNSNNFALLPLDTSMCSFCSFLLLLLFSLCILRSH